MRYWPPHPRSAAKRDERILAIDARVDDGVADGGEVSMFYDPMIAKLITWAPTREAAIDAQVDALDQFVIDGIGDNVDFLSALMQHPRFREGDLATDFIADEYPDGFDGAPADEQLIADLAVIAGMVAVITDERAAEINDQLGPPTAFPVRARRLHRRRRAHGADQALQGRHARGARRRRARSTSSAAGCRGSGC